MWKALIADDDELFRDLTLEILKDRAHCDVAMDGEEALTFFHDAENKNQKYDFILLDISMPKSDGGEVLMQIRETESERGVLPALRTPVFMITIHETMRTKAFYIGCDGYFVKPIEVVDLFKAIEQKLDMREWVRKVFVESMKSGADLKEYTDIVLKNIKTKAGFDSIALRVRDKNGDFPYFHIDNLPPDFIISENHILKPEDPEGGNFIDCMCSNIIKRKYDPSLVFFSEKGSFWVNNLSDVLANPPEKLKPWICKRDGCKIAGFNSVGIFPLIIDDEVIGLLQLSDRKNGMFAADKIREYELLASSIATTLKEKLPK